MRKIHCHSLAARLTAAQRAELFDALSAGLGYDAAEVLVHGWVKANEAAVPAEARPARVMPLPKARAIYTWYRQTAARRRDDPASAWRAQGLKPAEIVAREKLELARAKLELEREKLAYLRSRDRLLEQARVLVERAQEENGGALQGDIDLFLDELERMKRGLPPGNGYDLTDFDALDAESEDAAEAEAAESEDEAETEEDEEGEEETSTE